MSQHWRGWRACAVATQLRIATRCYPPHCPQMYHGGCSRPGPSPKGGGGGLPSTDPKMVVCNNGFCGHWRFCFRHTAGGNFFLTLCVYTQNTQNFVQNSKMDEKHKKGF